MLKKLLKKQEKDGPQVESKSETILDDSELEKLQEKAENMDEEEIQKTKKHFSIEELWKKIKKYSKKAGSSVIYVVLILYYTLQKPEIPKAAKLTIAGALGYFILPVDLIPDLMPGVGYVDDFSVLMAAIFQVLVHIDEDVKNQAKNKLKDIFGENIDTSEVDSKL